MLFMQNEKLKTLSVSFFLEPNGVEQSNESSCKYNFATPSSYFKLPILFCFVFYQIVGNNSVN